MHETCLTVRAVIELYLAHEARRRPDSRDLQEKTRVLNDFEAAHGETTVADCKAFALVSWIAEHPQWKSDWTLRRVYATVGRPFSWAKKLGLIDRHPFAGLAHPPGQRGVPMKPEQWLTLMRSTSALFRRVLFFQALTGARPCEMAALKWEDVSFDRRCAVLYVHKTARTRKDRAPRVIVLLPVVMRLLEWIRRQPGADQVHVFHNARGNPWHRSALALRIRRLREKIGLPTRVKLYGLRHLFGTNSILAGNDIKTTAELLGHTSVKMAEHYVHVAGQVEYLHEAAEKAARKIRRA